METVIYNHMLAGPDWGFKDYQFASYETVVQQPIKIAALMVFFDLPNYFAYDSEIANLDFSQFDIILLSSIEPERYHNILEWASKKFKRFLLSVGSLERGTQLPPDIVYRPWWAFNIVNSNPVQSVLVSTKKYYFDVLLGARRTHRDFIMLSLQQRGLLDQNIVSYRNIFVGNFINNEKVTQHFAPLTLNWPYVSPMLTNDIEVKPVLDNSISSCVPWKIYQNTYFSIIAETLDAGNIFFLSEKTGKAFYARRPFVHFGIYGFLKQLRSLGFKTFDTVWDESYDTIPHNIDRWKRAMDTVEYIIKQNPDQILSQCQDILEHNFNHLLELKAQSRIQQVNMIKEYL